MIRMSGLCALVATAIASQLTGCEQIREVDVCNEAALGAPTISTLVLQLEQYYRQLNFASSEHPDPARHPKLSITFAKPTCRSESR